MPQLLRTLLLFVLVGPAIGGLVGCLYFTATIALPDIWGDPSNTFGHARWTEYFGTLALILIFSYPIGLAPAIASGISQFCVRKHALRLRLNCVFLVSATAVTVMALEQALFLNTWSPLPLLAAAVGAAALSLLDVRVPRKRTA